MLFDRNNGISKKNYFLNPLVAISWAMILICLKVKLDLLLAVHFSVICGQ